MQQVPLVVPDERQEAIGDEILNRILSTEVCRCVEQRETVRVK
jgi:hypothetical protein